MFRKEQTVGHTFGKTKSKKPNATSTDDIWGRYNIQY